MLKILFPFLTLLAFFMSCANKTAESETPGETKPVRLITLDPGHFHAALVQKSMYEIVDSVVQVYAPAGPDLEMHLNRIENFNKRDNSPTHWTEHVYEGDDFFEKMITEKAGNTVIISGNNQRKSDYILKSLQAGFNVLADKPMAILPGDFETLKEAFSTAEENDLLLYDIMTERYEITTILQRELSGLSEIFGTLEKGTPDKPAVTKESVHHFYKYVSGSILTRPPWFMDVAQQGEGLVDVTTHLVDLIQWECFPDQIIQYPEDIKINSARRWPTAMTLHQFKGITKLDGFPDYLTKDLVNDTTINIYCNGEINYTLKGIHAKASVIWNYQATEGGSDTHFSIMRGSKADLIIRQGKDTQFKPALYIEPLQSDTEYEKTLTETFASLQEKYPGVSLQKNLKGWEVTVPERYHTGHEAHFAEVTQKFLQYLTEKNMPEWEVPNMLAKYYTTTRALDVAKEKK